MPSSRDVLTPDSLAMLQAIAETGSFAAAARSLGLVPSALTYRVRQIEDALDVLLFDRSSRQAQPTEAGQALLHACGLPQDYRDSVLLVRDGLALSQSQAVITILAALPYPWNLASLLQHIPRRLRDRLYSWIAKNRQRIPFIRPHCTLPQSR